MWCISTGILLCLTGQRHRGCKSKRYPKESMGRLCGHVCANKTEDIVAWRGGDQEPVCN